MIRTVALFFLALTLATALYPISAVAGPPAHQRTPPLDHTLMAFKEQGAWYFLCTAPLYCQRILPHIQTYAPPPPLCFPVGCSVEPPLAKKPPRPPLMY